MYYQLHIKYNQRLPDANIPELEVISRVESAHNLIELLNKYILLEPVTKDNYTVLTKPDKVQDDEFIEKLSIIQMGHPQEKFLRWKVDKASSKQKSIEDIVKEEFESIN